jgi:hypothetical protein
MAHEKNKKITQKFHPGFITNKLLCVWKCWPMLITLPYSEIHITNMQYLNQGFTHIHLSPGQTSQWALQWGPLLFGGKGRFSMLWFSVSHWNPKEHLPWLNCWAGVRDDSPGQATSCWSLTCYIWNQQGDYCVLWTKNKAQGSFFSPDTESPKETQEMSPKILRADLRNWGTQVIMANG